jgi:hypothetical protein
MSDMSSSEDMKTLWEETSKNRDAISEVTSGLAEIRSELKSIIRQIQRNAPAPMTQNILVAVAVLTIFGSVMVYMTGQNSHALKREMDIRIAANDAQIAEIHTRMQVDDAREQQDAFERGRLESSFSSLHENFRHLDEMIHIQDRVNVERFIKGAVGVGELKNSEELRLHLPTGEGKLGLYSPVD